MCKNNYIFGIKLLFSALIFNINISQWILLLLAPNIYLYKKLSIYVLIIRDIFHKVTRSLIQYVGIYIYMYKYSSWHDVAISGDQFELVAVDLDLKKQKKRKIWINKTEKKKKENLWWIL